MDLYRRKRDGGAGPGARARGLVVVAGLAAMLAGCGSGSHRTGSAAAGTAPASTASTASTAPGAGSTAPDAAGTVWLCRPGSQPDPCAGPLDTTVVPATPARSRLPLAAPAAPAADCFYVYPTVSGETGPNADLAVQPAETDVAVAQVAPFSAACRVWAPMYRQVTVPALFSGGMTAATLDTAYESLLAGWRDYLAHDNGGRPVVFVGHSQGAAMLIKLLHEEVDADPALRARTLLAIILGGNVTVPVGGVVGGSFTSLPLCTAPGQDGCVIAYSTFPDQPPAGALFGRPGLGVSLLSGQTATSGVQVACTNPAALGGGTGGLHPLFVAAGHQPSPPVATTFVEYPDEYTARCESSGGATWLQVTALAAAGRPAVREVLGPAWGYHVDDVSLALGDLVGDVRAAEATHASH